jgi:thiamine pyrophosphate-dependent acetolactate synthase large subunit-like protein
VQASWAMGAFAERARTEQRLLAALEAGLSRRGPSVIEVPIDRGLMPPLGERLRALSQSFGATKPGAAS